MRVKEEPSELTTSTLPTDTPSAPTTTKVGATAGGTQLLVAEESTGKGMRRKREASICHTSPGTPDASNINSSVA